jgi:hypothetical protein
MKSLIFLGWHYVKQLISTSLNFECWEVHSFKERTFFMNFLKSLPI